MRLKVYHAPNIGAAMTMVRTELGPDALILASRSIDGGVEVTAARENAPTAPAPLPDPNRQAAMRWHGVPADMASKFAAGDLITAIGAALRFSPLPCEVGASPLLLVGPPGAGKTLTTARLATRLVLAGQRAHVITADAKRAGAAEQLAAFTRLLGLTLIAAEGPLTLARAIAHRQEGAPVLVDTPGLHPANPADRDLLRELQAASGATMALVLPAGLDPSDAHDMAAGFKELGATLLVATRLDQSRRLGGILAAAGTGLALTEGGINPGVADGLRAVTPAFLAARLTAGQAGSPGPAAVAPAPVSALAQIVRAGAELKRSFP